MTRDARHLYRRKQRAYDIAKKSLKASDWEEFCRLRKALQTNLKRAYWDYVNRLLDPSQDKGSKGVWTYLKAKRRSSAGVAPLKTDGKLVTDAKDKATVLNQQFSSVFTREYVTTLGLPHDMVPYSTSK